MFKVLLLIYTANVGSSHQFSFQEFPTMSDCNTVISRMSFHSNLWTTRGGTPVPNMYSVECIPMVGNDGDQSIPPTSTPPATFGWTPQ